MIVIESYSVSAECGINESSGQMSDGLSPENSAVVGSITSKKYHRPDCRYAQKIKPENLVRFENAMDARRQGYLPCKSCNP
jgi:methylphosphotriester-DNA--protein-cysteine methyltransferase